MTSFPVSAGRSEVSPPTEMIPPVGPASLNTLVVSLQAMKERCIRNQKLIDQLEDENRSLKQRQRRYEVDFRRLREENLRFELRMEELEQVLNEKVAEIQDLQAQVQLSNEIRMETENQQRFEDKIHKLTPFSTEGSLLSDNEAQSDDDDDDDVLTDAMAAQSRMDELKRRLLQQNDVLKKIGVLMSCTAATNSIETDVTPTSTPEPTSEIRSEEPPAAAPIVEAVPVVDAVGQLAAAAAVAAVVAAPDGVGYLKICPMCESQFSPAKVSQEAFEAHVLAHFQGEEEEDHPTMIPFDQYDFVPDASW